jgi:PAS domain S-box-containing protein
VPVVAGGQTDFARGSAADRLAQLRRQTLELLLAVALAARLVPILMYGVVSWRAGNYPFLVTASFEVIVYSVLLAGRRLPLRLRSWGYCLVWTAVFAVYVPRGVFAVPLVNAVASAIVGTVLLGPYAGAGMVLTIIALLTLSAFLPPEVLAALSFGPPHPSRPEAPLIVATGIASLIAAPVALGIVLRGLVRGMAEAQVDEERFRGMIQASPDAMAVMEWPSERHRHVNPAFERLLGWPAAEAVGRTPAELELLRPQDQELLRGRVGEGAGLSGFEILLRRRDGTSLLAEVGLQRTQIGGSDVVLVVLRDMTAQRRLEAAVRQMQRVEAMGALAGGIAHNFRNALGAILPNLTYCLEQGPDELRAPLEDARSAASAAVDLASRLTRMAHQGESAGREPVELRGVLADVVGIARSTFGARITLRASIDVAGTALGNRGELHQVFLNLLLNARDAVAETSVPCIDVTLTRSADGARLIAVVADNGCGIEPAALRRLGEPFFTTKPEGKGTGLGLFSAFAAVREAGGRLLVTSQPGAGSTFTIELPAAAEPAGGSPGGPAHALRPGVRALVVDDDALLLEAVSRQLASLGLGVEPTTDPVAALDRLRKAPDAFDLLITDLDMPVMTGQELAARVHQVAPGLPIVVLSGTPEQAPIAGAAAVLAKPATSGDLADVVARCLGLEARSMAR